MVEEERQDLAALLHRLTKALVAAELPLLERHGLGMWAYVVLTELSRGAAPTQLALARAVDVDKTKMVSIIDGMEAEGLVSRRPDPDDRRARIIEPTAEGRERWSGARAAIRRLEDDFLAELPAAGRTTLLAALHDLSGEPLTRLTATSGGGG
ncbi:MarR family winged helix-turn-helix transcriptional regulator [Saccharothrix luteola]|uniref:MarR family winged helix-turn-helix transcriptional regulator n=1 Tax=Saccharothrix luteola TaxID=2893018 RepID=UPI001E2E39ED|nr:MarR family transcriptional regulator [Saccharothrix luteola]MCC8243756.1 MarR family transcriptional regulator [Saccharothrix luteola]